MPNGSENSPARPSTSGARSRRSKVAFDDDADGDAAALQIPSGNDAVRAGGLVLDRQSR